MPQIAFVVASRETWASPERRGTILVVDDDAPTRMALEAQLRGAGHETLGAGSNTEARQIIDREGALDAVLLDVMMPEQGGLHLLAELRDQRPQLPVIMVTASDAVENAVFALRHGAFDYLVKPVPKSELLLTVNNAVERSHMQRELEARRALAEGPPVDDGQAVFNSSLMRGILGVIQQVKDARVPILLLGESGTGKEVLARYTHRISRRKDQPFVAVNCATLAPELAMSELFGHERGAFTGAVSRQAGRFEEADGGTLFLDEVAELDERVQAQLLRVLQDQEITPVGGATTRVDVRVIVATHKPLEEEVQAGRFREDLYFRLDVIPITVPPLSARREEIPSLARHLLERFLRSEGLGEKRLSAESLRVLSDAEWPGNVRELENVLKRSALLAAGTLIEPSDLLLVGAARYKKRSSQVVELAPREKDSRPEDNAGVMLQALAETKGNVSEAARKLGIGRATFYRWAKRHALPL
ncbi:MAG: sigma-54 dependent transcriptional regulator [Myxococcota bacterium]